LRSALTMLGIVIGVGAVIAMVSVGEGAKAAVQAQIATFGTNVLIIFPGSMNVGGVRSGHGGAVTLTTADMEELAHLEHVTHSGWARRDAMQAVHENKNWFTTVNGVTPSYLIIRNWSIATGDFFTQADMELARNVVLVGKTVADNLYALGEDPVGTVLRLKNIPFRVVGTLAAKGFDTRGTDQDDVVFLPFTTAERKLMGTKFQGAVGAGFLSAEAPEFTEQVAAEAKRVLRQRHRIRSDQDDDFTLRNQLDSAKIQESTTDSMTWMLLAVASISLLVGGIGIMNILLVSVTERTREIGIRIAVGAKRWHIVLQFLVEAVVLSTMGGAIGVALGVAGANLMSHVAGWPTVISAEVMVVAFAFSACVGIFFGLYPANKASRLNPIDALRYE
jgi:putative ABC transport system permease protein